MATTIAEYYIAELLDWNNAIIFYNEEMEEIEQKLAEVISRNSIVGIAEKVEFQQTLLNNVSDKFYKLQNEIQEQSGSLQSDGKLKEDALISNDYELKQFEIRQKMNTVEKDYIDKKLNCYNFLSATLKNK
jgi:hypothetical protein